MTSCQCYFWDIWMDIWLDGCPLLSSEKCPLNIHAAFAVYQWFIVKNGHLIFEKKNTPFLGYSCLFLRPNFIIMYTLTISWIS